MTDPRDFAFPFQLEGDGNWECGLTKREYIATMALQGYLSACSDGDYPMPNDGEAARAAVGYADAIIKALNDTSDLQT